MSLIEFHLDQEHEGKAYRLGLAGAGGLSLYVAFALANTAPLVQSPPINVALLLLCGALGLGLWISAALPRPPDRLRWLILGVALCELFTQSAIWAQTSNIPAFMLVDPGLYTEFAGRLLLDGHNPYDWDYAGALDVYRPNPTGGTPRLNGAPESNYPYPALPILLVIPFQWLSLPGVFSLSVSAHALTLTLLFVTAPRPIQPLVLLPIILINNFTVFTTIGNLDIVWAGLLTAMVVCWRRPTLRAILYGLAISFKQSPWLIAPFLLIRLWREVPQKPGFLKPEGTKPGFWSVSFFALLSGAIFLLINGPFMLLDFRAWLSGATEPLQDTLIVLSQGGLSGLTHFGLLHLPKGYFLFATLVVFAALLFGYWRHYDLLRDALWATPGLVTWFSYRSLLSYWIYWAFPILATIITRGDPHPQPLPQKGRWASVVALAVLAATVTGAGIVLAASPSPIQLRMQSPLWTTGGRINGMTVEVTNTSDKTLTPRFSIQSGHAAHNPLLWGIDEGPRTLAPGESALYRLSSQRDERTFFAQDAAQLVVTDASGDYALRGITVIEPDRSFLWPDAITNTSYRYWDSRQHSPISWSLLGEGAISLIEKEGREALHLALNDQRHLRLTTSVSALTPPFGLWVYSKSRVGVEQGLEISDGDHVIRLVFGAGGDSGLAADGAFVIRRSSSADQWTYQSVDVQTAYAEAGWPLPQMKRISHRGLNVDWRLITLSLYVSAETPMETNAYFGPIEQSDYRVPPQALMAEALNDPADHYVRAGEAYLYNRNYTRALDSFQRALAFTPNDPRALSGLEQAVRGLNGEGAK